MSKLTDRLEEIRQMDKSSYTQDEETVIADVRTNFGGLRSTKYLVDFILKHGNTRKIQTIKLLRMLLNEAINEGVRHATDNPKLYEQQLEARIDAAYKDGVRIAYKLMSQHNDLMKNDVESLLHGNKE